MHMFRTVLGMLLLLSVMPGCSDSKGPTPTATGSGRSAEASSGYVGSARCGACHARNYHSWLATRHAGALAVPGPHDMETAATLGDHAGGDLPTLSAKGDAWSIVTGKPGADRESLRVAYAIDGPRRRLFVVAGPDGKLQVPPLQIDAASGAASAPDTPDGATQDWLKDCAGCHVTGLRPGNGEWSEIGVGCEACHGPGARHAGAKDPGMPGTIFNPGNVPDQARAMMVCGRCHTRGVSAQGKAYPEGFEPGMDFRAGFRQATAEDQNLFWPDGSPRASRLQYQAFNRSDMRRHGVKCWSCHNPHKSSEGSGSDLRLAGGSLCRSCHPSGSGPEGPTHAIHGNAACRTCHMPLTAGPIGAGDVASHVFRPVLPDATLTLGAGDSARQPNSCTLCHYHDRQPPAQLQEFLKARARSHYEARPFKAPQTLP